MARDRSSVTAAATRPRATEAGIGPYPSTTAGLLSPPEQCLVGDHQVHRHRLGDLGRPAR